MSLEQEKIKYNALYGSTVVQRKCVKIISLKRTTILGMKIRESLSNIFMAFAFGFLTTTWISVFWNIFAFSWIDFIAIIANGAFCIVCIKISDWLY